MFMPCDVCEESEHPEAGQCLFRHKTACTGCFTDEGYCWQCEEQIDVAVMNNAGAAVLDKNRQIADLTRQVDESTRKMAEMEREMEKTTVMMAQLMQTNKTLQEAAAAAVVPPVDAAACVLFSCLVLYCNVRVRSCVQGAACRCRRVAGR